MHTLREKMPELLDRMGLTEESLIRDHLIPALEAKETKFFAHEGRVVSTRVVRNLDAHNDALDLAFRLHGSFPKPANGFSGDVNVLVSIVGRDAELMAKYGPGAATPAMLPDASTLDAKP